MPYFKKGNSTPRKSPRATPRKNYKKKAAPQTFVKRVQAIVSGNIENKMSISSKFERPVTKWIATDPEHFLAAYNNFFNMSQGTDQAQRVGNQIKLKRWIIKGFVTPSQSLSPGLDTTPYDIHGFIGTVKIMLLKTRNNQPISTDLTRLLQNGATAVPPLGSQFDVLYPVNKDLYKVYWTRTFKCGSAAANPTILGSGASLIANYYPIQANNDYKMQHSFGLDVCKYIGKDAKITFNDGTTQAILPASMNNITLVAFWSPFTGDLTQSSTKNLTFYKISILTHFEYEDC